MERQTTYHVFPAGDLWRLRPEVPRETGRLYATKEDAIEAGAMLTANSDELARVIVHDEAGRIQTDCS
jgi:hypothetical protein